MAETATEETELRLENDEDLVKIVTIHKSKGLEYPVVFAPFLWVCRPSIGITIVWGFAVGTIVYAVGFTGFLYLPLPVIGTCRSKMQPMSYPAQR